MGQKPLNEALREYERVFVPSRNWAAKTRVNYRNDIADLIRFLEKQGKADPNRVDLQDLEAFMAELDRGGYTGTTRRRKTSSIKSFFSFLEQYGYITNNVAERLIPPAREHKEPRVLTTREYQALLRACSHDIRGAAILSAEAAGRWRVSWIDDTRELYAHIAGLVRGQQWEASWLK